MKDKFQFYIAGLKFHQYDLIADVIKEDDHLQLEQDLDNKFDPFAVKILYNLAKAGRITPVMLGHVPMKMKQSEDVFHALDYFGEYTCVVIKHLPEAPPYERLKVLVEFSDG